MVEVVVDVRLALDEPEPQAFGDVEVGATVLARDVNAFERAERLVQIRHTQRHVLERAPLPRSLLGEERQLPAPRIRADERELVGPLDDVHAHPLGQKVRDPVAIGDPERHVVESLGPHPVFHPIYGTRPRPGLFLPIDRGQELPLVHLRAALDVEALRLVVELLLRLAGVTAGAT